MMILRQDNGAGIKLGKELASGGEGKIYSIVGDPDQVAKILHKPTPAMGHKLRAMLANRPHDPTYASQGHFSIAWPTARILDERDRCVGFTMPYINPAHSFPLLKLYHPRDRQQTRLDFTWEYLLRMAHNLSIVVAELHRRGYVVGDLNESNILVTSSALTTLVDCDSIQVPVPQPWWTPPWQRRFFRCTVGKSEYTPPELQNQNFSHVNRKPHHDNFSLGVLIFLMLMEGRHPFAGVWKGSEPPPPLEQHIHAGRFPYAGSRILIPPKHALPFTALPPDIRLLMSRCFTSRIRLFLFCSRPSSKAWALALRRAEQHLIDCKVNKLHVYSSHLARCPWCDRIRMGIPDSFPMLSTPHNLATRRFRRRPLRRYQFLLFRILLVFATLGMYTVELYIWNFYTPLLSHASLQMKSLLWLLLVILPLIISSVLYISIRE